MFVNAAYARDGQTDLMVQTLLETGTRVSEFVALYVEDVSFGERTITVEGGKRRSGPLFVSREKGAGRSRVSPRQRIGQIVREIARIDVRPATILRRRNA